MLSGIISFFTKPDRLYLQSPLKKAPGLKLNFYPGAVRPATAYTAPHTTGKPTSERLAVSPKVLHHQPHKNSY